MMLNLFFVFFFNLSRFSYAKILKLTWVNVLFLEMTFQLTLTKNQGCLHQFVIAKISLK